MLSIISLLILLVTSAFDHLIAGFSIGIEKIKVSCFSMMLLSFLGSSFLLLSCLFSEKIATFLSSHSITLISTFFFFILGIQKIMEALENPKENRQNLVSSSNMRKIFNIYHDPKTADFDHSKSFSMKELVFLSFALSLDNLTVGMALGICSYSLFLLICFYFLISFLLFYLGNRISYTKWNTSSKTITFWSGIIFLLVGFYRIFC